MKKSSLTRQCLGLEDLSRTTRQKIGGKEIGDKGRRIGKKNKSVRCVCSNRFLSVRTLSEVHRAVDGKVLIYGKLP